MTRTIYLTEKEFRSHLWWAFLAGSVYNSENLINKEFYTWYENYTKDFQDYSDAETYRNLLEECWTAAQLYEGSDHAVDVPDFNEWLEKKFS